MRNIAWASPLTEAEQTNGLHQLRYGRAILFETDWVQEFPEGDPDKNCALTALNGFADGAGLARYALDQAARTLFPERVKFHSGDCILAPAASVNDHPDTSFNDVMAMYDEAERIIKEDCLA